MPCAAAFDGPLPRGPEGLEAAYDDFRRTVVPYSMGNDHPRFWGWYMGAGNPVGNLADLLASVLNPNMGGADHAPVLVEQQVVRWCAEAAGYPTSASGLLVTGASEANLVGLAVARTVQLGPEVRTDGIPGARRFGVYASTEVHSCHRKSLELLGLGESSLRTVPVRGDCVDGRRRPRGGRRGRPGGRHRAARASSRPSARSTPARSTTSRPSPTSPSARGSGCTSTVPSVASSP